MFYSSLCQFNKRFLNPLMCKIVVTSRSLFAILRKRGIQDYFKMTICKI